MKYKDEESCETEKVLFINVIFERIMKCPPVLNLVRLDSAGEIQKFHWSIFWKKLLDELMAVSEKKTQRETP
jgi:hypothetical protein